jgi:hypothetical protein
VTGTEVYDNIQYDTFYDAAGGYDAGDYDAGDYDAGGYVPAGPASALDSFGPAR